MGLSKEEITKENKLAIENQPENAYMEMDLRDENQIIQEMQGETTLIEEYVYSFKQGARQVTSLSYAGVKEMVRRRGRFEILSVETSESDKTIRALVKIRDTANKVDFLGASEAEKDKPFAYVLAINKAERNAYMKAMPAKLLAQMVDAFLHGNKPEAPAPKPQTQTPKGTLTADQIYAEFPPMLADNLDFKTEENAVTVKARGFLESDMFKDVCAIVQGLGGERVGTGKDAYWRIPTEGGS